jgi:FAD synthase
MRVFISNDQWVEKTPSGVRYYDGVHRGHADTLAEALLACQSRYDYARGIRGRPPGEHVYGNVSLRLDPPT